MANPLVEDKVVKDGRTQLSVWIPEPLYWKMEEWRAKNQVRKVQDAVATLLTHALTNPPPKP